MEAKICKGPGFDGGCDRPARPTRGYCAQHDAQHRQGMGLRPIAHQKPRRKLGPREDSSVPAAERFNSSKWDVTPTGCWEWNRSRVSGGYGTFTEGPGVRVYAHRFAASQKLGRPLTKQDHVAHSCDNPPCVNPDHLSVGAQRDNMRDMAEKHRSTFGERNPMAKLTVDQVIDIKSRVKQGSTHASVAQQYGIARRTVGGIVTGGHWAHALALVEEPSDER